MRAQKHTNREPGVEEHHDINIALGPLRASKHAQTVVLNADMSDGMYSESVRAQATFCALAASDSASVVVTPAVE
eukprot:401841-Amphidinium_carterae.1